MFVEASWVRSTEKDRKSWSGMVINGEKQWWNPQLIYRAASVPADLRLIILR